MNIPSFRRQICPTGTARKRTIHRRRLALTIPIAAAGGSEQTPMDTRSRVFNASPISQTSGETSMDDNVSSPHYMDSAAPPSYDDLEKLIHLVCDGDVRSTRAMLSALPEREFAAVTKAVIETRQHHHDIYDQVLRLIALEAVTRANGQDS